MLDNKKKVDRDEIPKIKAKFKFLPDVATADLAFEAFGKDYSELFENAALALEEVMVDTSTIQSKTDYLFEIETESVEDLLFRFLEEMVYLKDAEELLFNKVKCKVMTSRRHFKRVEESQKEKGKWKLKAKFFGDKISYKTHKLRDDVKAITKHLFEVKEIGFEVFVCRVVLDV